VNSIRIAGKLDQPVEGRDEFGRGCLWAMFRFWGSNGQLSVVRVLLGDQRLIESFRSYRGGVTFKLQGRLAADEDGIYLKAINLFDKDSHFGAASTLAVEMNDA
jgi:hypothetical protein